MINYINYIDMLIFHVTNEILLVEIEYNPQQLPVPTFIYKIFKKPSNKYDLIPFLLKESKQNNKFTTEHHYFPD